MFQSLIRLYKEKKWLIFAITAAICWGIWGILAKFISSDINPYTNHFLFSIGMLFTLPFVLPRCKKKELNRRGILWGVLAGILAITGNIAVYYSFSSGGLAAVVIPVTNLYPLVTIFIAVLVLKERMHWMNAIGIIIVIPAIIILSGETELLTNPGAFLRGLGLKLWLIAALVALVFWGFFSAAQKVTTNHISAEWSYLTFIVTSVLISAGFLVFGLIEFRLVNHSLVMGSLAGMLNGFGVLAAFTAYRNEGKASLVTTIAGALQPVFTIFLALLFLNERLTLIEFSGISLAILASLFLSVEKKSPEGIQNPK